MFFGLLEKCASQVAIIQYDFRSAPISTLLIPPNLILSHSPAFAIKSVKKMNVPYKFIVPGLDVYKSM